MLTNAILLDTICVNKPSKRLGKSAAFVHHMYCPISIDGVHAIAKLYVTEEVGNINKFYLTKIEMVPADSRVLGKNAFAPNSSVDTKISIADIYNFVKSNNDEYEADSDEPVSFNPKPVNPALLNEDKTPKVVYHGTDEEFAVFDITKSRSYYEAPDYDLPGFYFSESVEESSSYGNLGQYYIRISNPYDGTAEEYYDESKRGV